MLSFFRLLAIREACKILKQTPNQNQNAAIVKDSQAAVKAINSAISSSKLVQQCRDELANLNINLGVTLIWVPGYSGIVGNERADEVGRQELALNSSLAEMVNISSANVLLWQNTRMKCFGKAFFQELDELSEKKIRDLIFFLNATKWLQHNRYEASLSIYPFQSKVKRVFGIKTAHYSANWI